MPCGTILPFSLSLKSCMLTSIGQPLVPEVADQLLLLRVDGDRRLVGRLRRLHLRVDVLELRVSIGMARSLVRLAIDLA